MEEQRERTLRRVRVRRLKSSASLSATSHSDMSATSHSDESIRPQQVPVTVVGHRHESSEYDRYSRGGGDMPAQVIEKLMEKVSAIEDKINVTHDRLFELELNTVKKTDGEKTQSGHAASKMNRHATGEMNRQPAGETNGHAAGEMRPGEMIASQEEAQAESDADLESADAADLNNLYSYALTHIEELLARPHLRPKDSLRLLLLMLLPLGLTTIQLFFAYGFYDASLVLKVQGTLAGFRDPLAFSFWYAESVIPGTQAVLLNVILSVCAIVLLGVYLKNDNEGTMLTVCPLELLCLPRTKGKRPHVFANGPLSACWRIIVVAICQTCWCLRSLLVPVLAGYGTVGAMLNSSNGQDIVLNSVAIAFVLELDDFLYDNLLGEEVAHLRSSEKLPLPTEIFFLRRQSQPLKWAIDLPPASPSFACPSLAMPFLSPTRR